jgi:hypothetical protein
MKMLDYAPIRDIVFGLVCSLLLTVAFLAAAWGSGSFRPWGSSPREAARGGRRRVQFGHLDWRPL